MRRTVTLLLLVTGCEGEIRGGGGELPGTVGPTDPAPKPAACDTRLFPDAKLEAIAQDFEHGVFPKLAGMSGGCVGCHAPGLGRQFTVTPGDAEQTFYDAWSNHFFDEKPGSLVD